MWGPLGPLCISRQNCQTSASQVSLNDLRSTFGRLDVSFIKWGWWAFPCADRLHQLPGTHLISAFLGQKALLINDHPEGEAQHDSAMATVPKHHRKQEGESNDSVGSCRRERLRSSAPSKQKGLIREAVCPIRPFLIGTALKGLLQSSLTHQAVRSGAELALPSQRLFNCTFLANLTFVSCLTIINTMCKQLHSVLQHKKCIWSLLPYFSTCSASTIWVNMTLSHRPPFLGFY